MLFFASAKKLLRKTGEWKLGFLLSLCDCSSLLKQATKYHGKMRTWQECIFIHIYKTHTNMPTSIFIWEKKKRKTGGFSEIYNFSSCSKFSTRLWQVVNLKKRSKYFLCYGLFIEYIYKKQEGKLLTVHC